MAVVVLVVPCDVCDLAGEGVIGPLDAPGLLVDIPCENYQINPSIEGRRVEMVDLGVEV